MPLTNIKTNLLALTLNVVASILSIELGLLVIGITCAVYLYSFASTEWFSERVWCKGRAHKMIAYGMAAAIGACVGVGLLAIAHYKNHETSQSAIDKDREKFQTAPNYPRFTEKQPDGFTLLFGGISMQRLRSELQKGNQSPVTIGDSQPFTMYLENNTFYVDVELFGGQGLPRIAVKRNVIEATGPEVKGVNGDKQSTDKAFEVVANGVVVFQMILNSNDKVTINGLFPRGDGQVLLVTPRIMSVGTPSEVLSKTTLKPLFKYPSWQFPGQYDAGPPKP